MPIPRLPAYVLCAAGLLQLCSLPCSAAPSASAMQPGREAQRAAAAAKVGIMRVHTATEMAAALEFGVRHVVVQEHLDLRELPVLQGASPVLFRVDPAIQSVQGNCSAPPPSGIPVKPLRPSQCVLLTQAIIFSVEQAGVLWLDNLYLRGARSNLAQPDFYAIAQCIVDGSELRVTNSTFQSDGGHMRAFGTEAGCRSYLQDVAFHDFIAHPTGDAPAVEIGATEGQLQVTSCLMDRCTFRNNSNYAGQRPPNKAFRGGVVSANTDSFAGLREWTFTDSYGPDVGKDDLALVYSSPPIQVWVNRESSPEYEQSLPMSESKGIEGVPRPWLTLNDPSFLATKRNLSAALNAETNPPVTPPLAETDELSESDFPTAAIAGIAVAGAALIAMILGCGLLYARKRTQRDAAGGAQKVDAASALVIPAIQASLRTQVTPDKSQDIHNKSASSAQAARSNMDLHGGSAAAPKQASMIPARLSIKTMPSSLPPTASTSESLYSGSDARRQATPESGTHSAASHQPGSLAELLDMMHEKAKLFLGRYRVGGAAQRRVDGQATTQVIERAHDDAAFIVKFFNDQAACDRTLALYNDAALRESLLPIVQASATESKGPYGFVLPPFAITEHGEGLQEWIGHAAPDLPTTVFVLLHVVERLQKLHDAGWCHRDIKPANVLWRPNANAWALVGFASAARTGTEAHITYDTHYAAPELAFAEEVGAQSVLVTVAPDMWGIGVIAWELLTGAPVFPANMDKSAIAAILTGRSQLPWERPQAATQLLPKLRLLKRSVLQCLSRNPEERPTSRELLGAWNGLFESLTGTTRGAFVPSGTLQ